MKWTDLRTLIWNPEGRWWADSILVPVMVAASVMLWLRVGRGVGVGALVGGILLREVLFHVFVRRTRVRGGR